MFLYRLQFKHPAYLILGEKWNSRQIVSKHYFCSLNGKIDSKVLVPCIRAGSYFFPPSSSCSFTHVRGKEEIFLSDFLWMEIRRVWKTIKRALNGLILYTDYYDKFWSIRINCQGQVMLISSWRISSSVTWYFSHVQWLHSLISSQLSEYNQHRQLHIKISSIIIITAARTF